MKTYFKLIISALAAALSLNTQCIIDSISLDRYGDQVICRIGEFHQDIYNPNTPEGSIEKRDSQEIINLIKAIAQTKQPVTLIIEAGTLVISILHTKKLPEHLQYSSLPEIALKADVLMRQYPNLHISTPDKTDFKSSEFARLFDCFAATSQPSDYFINPLFQALPKEDRIKFEQAPSPRESSGPIVLTAAEGLVSLDSFIKNNPHIKEYLFDNPDSVIKRFASAIKKQCPDTLEALFGSIGQLRESLLTAMSALDQRSQYAKFLEQVRIKTDQATESLQTYFQSTSSYRPDQPCVDALCDALKERTFSDAFNQSGPADTLATFFDADLAIELNKALANHSHVIIFCGANHTNNLDELITSIGCIPVLTPRKDLSTQLAKSHLTNSELKAIFSEIKAAFDAKHAPQQEATKPACVICGKTETLKQCARCHTVSYCSRECQTKDWSTHKQICKAK